MKRIKITEDQLKRITENKPISPQEKKKVDDAIASIDAVIKAEEEKLELLKKHRQGLIQQLGYKDVDYSLQKLPGNLRFPEFRDETPPTE